MKSTADRSPDHNLTGSSAVAGPGRLGTQGDSSPLRRSSNSFLSQFPFGLLPLTFEAMGIRPTRHETGRAASHHRLAVTPNPRRDSGLGHISAEQELVAFSSLLQCIRCARCKARLKIDWRALIRETKKMLNELGMVFFFFFCSLSCSMWTIVETDASRLHPPVPPLLQVPGLVLHRRRHIQKARHPRDEPCSDGREL